MSQSAAPGRAAAPRFLPLLRRRALTMGATRIQTSSSPSHRFLASLYHPKPVARAFHTSCPPSLAYFYRIEVSSIAGMNSNATGLDQVRDGLQVGESRPGAMPSSDIIVKTTSRNVAHDIRVFRSAARVCVIHCSRSSSQSSRQSLGGPPSNAIGGPRGVRCNHRTRYSRLSQVHGDDRTSRWHPMHLYEGVGVSAIQSSTRNAPRKVSLLRQP